MGMASGLYGATLRDALKNGIAIDWTAITNKVALYNDTATPNFSADPSSYSTTGEVVGSGYTAGGIAISTPTLLIVSGLVVLDFDDPAWASPTTITATGLILYANGLTPKANIGAMSFGGSVSSLNGSFTVQLDPAGAFALNEVPA